MPSDLRLACRSLAKSPAFAGVSVAALALGIGANIAIFSLVSQVLLNPAGVRNPERIVALRVHYDKLALKNIPVSIPDFMDVRDSTSLFESTTLLGVGDFNYTGGPVPERLRGATVSYRWFDVFGARPVVGRVFTPEEDKQGANQEVVLSFAAWKRLFGQERSVIGRAIDLNQKPYRIIGVMGPDFRWPSTSDFWVPLGLPDSAFSPNNRFNENYEALARLRPGVEFSKAAAWVQLLTNRYKQSGGRGPAYANDSAWGMFLLPFTDYIAEDTKTPLLILLGAVGFVLLIACSSIAGLMLARTSGRARDVAVRAALGATRWDLTRGTLTEAFILSSLGAVAGLAVSWLAVRGAIALAPEGIVVAALDARVDPLLLLFTAGAALAAGLLFALAPVWQVLRMGRYEPLKEGGRSGTAGMARQKLRSTLVAGEVALALVLLVGAGLLLRSLSRIEEVNPGFDPAGILTANVSLPPAQYSDDARQIAFYRAVSDRLAALPGVTSAAVGRPVPFTGNNGSASFQIEGRPTPPGDPGPHGNIGIVSPSYFSTMRIPIRSGRVFTDQDRAGTAPVALVDETLARQYWPGEDPVGKHIRNGGPNRPWATIVGVVGHVRHNDLSGEDVKGKYYFTEFQRPAPFGTLLIRANAPERLGAALRQAVQSVDPSQPVSQILTMSDMVSASLATKRFVVILLGLFAGTALLMALLGLYGVIAYLVAQRTQELGIRMALGAQYGDVLKLVLVQGMRLAGAGALAGLLASLLLTRLLRSQLFHVSAFDPLTFILVAAILLAAALAASYFPARRATRVDPMEALRYE